MVALDICVSTPARMLHLGQLHAASVRLVSPYPRVLLGESALLVFPSTLNLVRCMLTHLQALTSYWIRRNPLTKQELVEAVQASGPFGNPFLSLQEQIDFSGAKEQLCIALETDLALRHHCLEGDSNLIKTAQRMP